MVWQYLGRHIFHSIIYQKKLLLFFLQYASLFLYWVQTTLPSFFLYLSVHCCCSRHRRCPCSIRTLLAYLFNDCKSSIGILMSRSNELSGHGSIGNRQLLLLLLLLHKSMGEEEEVRVAHLRKMLNGCFRHLIVQNEGIQIINCLQLVRSFWSNETIGKTRPIQIRIANLNTSEGRGTMSLRQWWFPIASMAHLISNNCFHLSNRCYELNENQVFPIKSSLWLLMSSFAANNYGRPIVNWW